MCARCTVGPGEAVIGAGPQLLQLLSPPCLDQLCISITWCRRVGLGASASECLDQAHMSPFPRACPRISQLHPVLWQVCVVLAIASPRLAALSQPVLPGFKCTWLADRCYCMPVHGTCSAATRCAVGSFMQHDFMDPFWPKFQTVLC